MRIPEVAEELSLSKSKTYQLVQSGEITSIKIDKSRRVTRESLNDYIDKKILEGQEDDNQN
jgi:excisionase family DNA binding protein